MKYRTTGIAAVLLTTLLASGCAGGPPRKTDAFADTGCQTKSAELHCITGEDLRRHGARDTADALRMAFPWLN